MSTQMCANAMLAIKEFITTGKRPKSRILRVCLALIFLDIERQKETNAEGTYFGKRKEENTTSENAENRTPEDAKHSTSDFTSENDKNSTLLNGSTDIENLDKNDIVLKKENEKDKENEKETKRKKEKKQKKKASSSILLQILNAAQLHRIAEAAAEEIKKLF